jgi:hypothetical protein
MQSMYRSTPPLSILDWARLHKSLANSGILPNLLEQPLSVDRHARALAGLRLVDFLNNLT